MFGMYLQVELHLLEYNDSLPKSSTLLNVLASTIDLCGMYSVEELHFVEALWGRTRHDLIWTIRENKNRWTD